MLHNSLNTKIKNMENTTLPDWIFCNEKPTKSGWYDTKDSGDERNTFWYDIEQGKWFTNSKLNSKYRYHIAYWRESYSQKEEFLSFTPKSDMHINAINSKNTGIVEMQQGNSDDKQILLTKIQEQEIEIASLKNKVKDLENGFMAVQEEMQNK